MTFTARFRNALAAVALTFCITGVARSQQDPATLLNDFIHYSIIANVDLALANGQKLLDSGISNAELATLIDEGKVETGRFERAISRAQLVPQLSSKPSPPTSPIALNSAAATLPVIRNASRKRLRCSTACSEPNCLVGSV
jgi:hypothetical protein